jgi:Domain of unknown function (DUF1906)
VDPQNDIYANRAATYVSSGELEATFNNGDDPGTWTVEVNSSSGSSSTVSFTVAAASGALDSYHPYTDATPGQPTAMDVVNAAENYIGTEWGGYNCTGLVWAVSDAIGADYYETASQVASAAGQSVSQIRTIVPDPGDPPTSPATPSGFLGYVLPQAAGTYGQWTTFASTTSGGDKGWTFDVRIGDLVRIPSGVLADGDVHSFIVVGGDQQDGWEVIDNTNPSGAGNPITISEHTFNSNPNNVFDQEVLGADFVYVSYLTTSVSSPPSLTSVSPTSYTANNVGQTMELFGSNFVSGDTLTFVDPQNDIYANRAATYVSSGELEATFNNGDDPGIWTVEVNSTSGNSSTVSFTVSGNSPGNAAEQGIDYRYTTATDPLSAADIKAAGKQFVVEYIGAANNDGYLRPAEVTQLEAQDLSIVSVFERSPTSISYFTTQQGASDAADAIAAAELAGQTPGTAIYFTVDFDPATGGNLAANLATIDQYFEAISSYFAQNGSPYSIGVYGSGAVLSSVLNDASVGAKYTWLADAPAWAGTSGYTGENLEQYDNGQTTIDNFAVDLDESFGQPFGAWDSASQTVRPVQDNFIGSGTSDILFRNNASGDTGFYQINNGASAGWRDIGASSTAYGIVGTGDFYGTGTSDILYRNNASGDTGFYQISNGANIGWHDIGASSTAYSVVGVGDFTGTGTDDILYRNNASGDTGFYQIVNGANIGWHDIGASSTAYIVVGVGDFTGSGTDDILYRNNTSGDTGFYEIVNGANVGWHDIGASSTAYSVVGVGDFMGTGTDDILYRNNASGDTGFYAISNGVNMGWHDIGASSTAYTVVATGDYLGNGTSDVLFRNNTTGDTGFYALSNGVNAGWHDIGASSATYHVAA